MGEVEAECWYLFVVGALLRHSGRLASRNRIVPSDQGCQRPGLKWAIEPGINTCELRERPKS